MRKSLLVNSLYKFSSDNQSSLRENLKKKLKIFIAGKFSFNKPKRSKILIYDFESLWYLRSLLKKRSYEIYYNRGEIINIYVLILTVFKNGLLKLKKNYKINYFKLVSPKIVLTSIDINPSFYLLKDLYPGPIYISFQASIKTKNNFLLNYIKTQKKRDVNVKFKTDYFFVLGKEDKREFSKYIDSKIIVLGSVRNNYFSNILNRSNGKLKQIYFISSQDPRSVKNPKMHWEYYLFSNLHSYCFEKKIKLFFISKFPKKYKNFYKSLYSFKGWNYLPKMSIKDTYNKINKAQFIIFSISTLGHEAIAKAKKIIYNVLKKKN